jgi:hypothetical protein
VVRVSMPPAPTTELMEFITMVANSVQPMSPL